MISLETVCASLASYAPLSLAESWDNVGLLVGDRDREVERVMTCLTITPAVVAEAVEERAELIVSHHPLPFKALARITADSVTGSMLLRLIQNATAIYSAHTAYDSAAAGINQSWAERLALNSVRPLIVSDPQQPSGGEASRQQPSGGEARRAGGDTEIGAGRFGDLDRPMAMGELVRQVAGEVGATLPRLVGPPTQEIRRVAFACGSGGSFLAAARRRGCDALITGEATFHTCLEAESTGIGLGLLGHYWSERFAMEQLAERLADEFPPLTVWASRAESDPIVPVHL